MNDLIAVNGGDFIHTWEAAAQDPTVLLGNVPWAGEWVQASISFSNGDWAGGLINFAAGAMSGIELAIDPIGTLLSSAAAFLIDYMPPLPQALDMLAGNPALVEGIGATWQNVSGALDALAGKLEADVAAVLASWEGPAADAYRQRMETLTGMVRAMGQISMGIGGGLLVASVIVAVVREIVKQLIADLVGRLIAYIIETGATLGVALPVVIGQAITAITSTTVHVTTFMDDLVTAVRNGAQIAQQVGDMLYVLQTVLAGIGAGVGQGQSAASA